MVSYSIYNRLIYHSIRYIFHELSHEQQPRVCQALKHLQCRYRINPSGSRSKRQVGVACENNSQRDMFSVKWPAWPVVASLAACIFDVYTVEGAGQCKPVESIRNSSYDGSHVGVILRRRLHRSIDYCFSAGRKCYGRILGQLFIGSRKTYWAAMNVWGRNFYDIR